MTKEEQLYLINWICLNYFKFTENRPHFMECTLYEDNPQVPPVIWEIRNRIIKREGIEEYENSYSEQFFLKFHNTLAGVTRDKMFILTPSIKADTMSSGRLNIHKDVNQPCRVHSRFNVCISIPTNDSKTHYSGHIVDCKERGYVLCRSGIDWHYTDTIKSTSTPRIAISFGFMLPMKVLDRIYKIPKIHWNLENLYFYIYRYLEEKLGYSDAPTMFNCSSISSIPSVGMLKDNPLYKNRVRGLPPFLTEIKDNIW